MKITVFWKYYDAYLRSFYERFPQAASQPYQQQLDTILDDGFNWPFSVARRLKEAGHDVQFIIENAKPLQRAWAKEHDVAFPPLDWRFSIPRTQVEMHRPDALWVSSAHDHYGEYLRGLKQFCRKVFAWIAVPTPHAVDLSVFDCILTSHANIVEEFRPPAKAIEVLRR